MSADEPEGDEENREEITLNRRVKRSQSIAAASRISDDLQTKIVAWVVRAGLGSAFLNHRPECEATPEEMGALLSSTWDPVEDELHADLLSTLHEWANETGTVVLTETEAEQIAELLVSNEEALISEFSSEPMSVEDTESGVWADRLRGEISSSREGGEATQ